MTGFPLFGVWGEAVPIPPQGLQMGYVACIVRGLLLLRMPDWKETFPSLRTCGHRASCGDTSGGEQGSVDGVRYFFRRELGMSSLPPSLYLFLYNSLDEGEWS